MPTLPQSNYKADVGKVHPKDIAGTPSWAVPPILPYLPKHWVLWEPAAGEGLLVEALELHGYTVIATELMTGTDYFGYEPEAYDCQVTNTPFSVKDRWFARACKLDKPFAILAPSSFMFTKTGSRLIQRCGMEVLIPDAGVRIDYKMINAGWDGAGAQFHSSWYTRGLGVGQMFRYVGLDKPKRHRAKATRIVEHPEQLEPSTTEFVQAALF